MLMRIYQWGLVVFITSVATVFLWPYLIPAPTHPLDTYWSSTTPRVLTFATENTSEQWQIVPLPLSRRAIIAPSTLFLAWPKRNDDTAYMIERTRVTPQGRDLIREYYSRQPDGDYLVGWQINGVVVPPFIPPILVRPSQLQAPTTWQAGAVNGTVTNTDPGCVTLALQGALLTGWVEYYCDGVLQSFAHPPFVENLTARAQLTQSTRITVTDVSPELPAATLQRIGSLDVLKFTNGPLGSLVYDEHQQQVIGSVLGGYIVAIDSVSGAERWRLIGAGEWYAQPVYDPFQGLIVAADTSGQVYAIDGDGRVIWQYDHPQTIVADPCATPAGIVIADINGTVVLLDTDGNVVWRVDTQQPVRSTPLWDEAQRAIIVVAQSGRVQAFDPTGGTRWTQGIDGTVSADPVLQGESVYVVDEAGTLTAIDHINGEIRWDFTSLAQPTWSATASQNRVAIANEHEIWIINALGDQIGHIQAENTAPPTLIGTELVTMSSTEVRIWDTTARTYRSFPFDSIRQANDTDLDPLRVIQPVTRSAHGLWWGDASGRVLALRSVAGPPLLPVRWQRTTLEADIKTLAFEYASVVSGSSLAVSDRFNTLFYVNTSNGTFQQQVTLPGGRILGMTASRDTTQTLLLQNDGITAITAGSNTPLWKLPLADITGGTLTAFADGEWLAWVHVRSHTYQLIRLNAQGGIVWQQSFDSPDIHPITHTPDFGFVAGTTAVDLRNGDRLWQSAVPLQAAFIRDTTVCGFHDDDGAIILRCLNRNDGSIDHLAATTLTTLPQQSIRSTEGAFVVTSDHLVSWMDAQGNVRWQSRPENIPIVHMQSYQQHALVIRSDGRIQLFADDNATPIAVVNDLPIQYSTNTLPGWRSDFPISADMLFLTSNSHIVGIDLSGVTHGK